MTKRLIIIAVVVALLWLQGCSGESNVSGWVWSDDGVGVRVGTKVSENNEAGLSMLHRSGDNEPRVVGLYGVHHFPEPVKFRNPLIVDFLPETLEGTAYLGGRLDVDLEMGETSMEPIAGIIFEDTLFFETSLDRPVLFGLRIKF